MLNLNKLEVLNLYLLLSTNKTLTDRIDGILVKLENEIFENYTVREIEHFRSVFNEKGRI